MGTMLAEEAVEATQDLVGKAAGFIAEYQQKGGGAALSEALQGLMLAFVEKYPDMPDDKTRGIFDKITADAKLADTMAKNLLGAQAPADFFKDRAIELAARANDSAVVDVASTVVTAAAPVPVAEAPAPVEAAPPVAQAAAPKAKSAAPKKTSAAIENAAPPVKTEAPAPAADATVKASPEKETVGRWTGMLNQTRQNIVSNFTVTETNSASKVAIKGVATACGTVIFGRGVDNLLKAAGLRAIQPEENGQEASRLSYLAFGVTQMAAGAMAIYHAALKGPSQSTQISI